MFSGDFTAQQRQAVEYDGSGDVCVIAGPGSGKTRVLVSRFAWLVRKKRIAPEQILAVTFTRKAALEMKKRLAADITPELAERAHVSTIDAFCAGLLREHAIEAGLDPDFGQLEPIDAEVELFGWVETALDQMWQAEPEAAVGFARVFDRKDLRGGLDVATYIAKIIESARSWGDQPRSGNYGDRHQLYRDWMARTATRALELFTEDKKQRSLMDFSDLTAAAVKLLREGKASRLPYKHILLDENQDTNPIQAELMRLLQANSGAPLFAVGDLNQSIYAFRNADPQMFADFRDAVNLSGKTVDLTGNFRSRIEILTAARLLTKTSGGVTEQLLTAERKFCAKGEPSVEIQFSRGGDAQQEARWAARRIAELKESLRLGKDGRAANWRDFAVLVRTNALLDDFSAGLQWAGIPYAVNAGRSFFSTSEVRDFLSLLWALDNPRDEVHLAAVLRSPLVGVHDATLLALKVDGMDLFTAIARPPQGLPEMEKAKLERFHARFIAWRRRRESMPLNVLIMDVAARTGFDAWLLQQDGGLQRSANVQKLAGLAGRAMESTGSFRKSVRRLDAMAKSIGGEGEATLPEDSTDAVRLMTVHAAKGLEFPVVVLGSIQNEGKTGSDAVLYSRETGIGVRWSDIDEKKDKAGDAPYQLLHPAAKKTREDEDARLFYVAMTRAEDHLVLSAGWTKTVQKRGWVKHISGLLKVEPAKDQPGVRVIEKHGVRVLATIVDQPPDRPQDTPGQVGEMQPQLVEPRSGTLGQSDSEASVTGVSQFAACPRRYYLSRYLGLERSAEEPSSTADDAGLFEPSAMELGREAHELLAGTLAPDKASEQARLLAQAFEDHDLGARVRQAVHVAREREIVFPVGSAPRLLRGVIDLHFEDAQGSVLVDYKTDRVSEAETAAKAEEYALQMRLYALALELQGKKPSKAVLFFLRLGKAVDVSLNAQSLNDAVRAAEEFFLAQESQQFPLKIAAHCRRCPHYRGLCPAQLPVSQKGQMQLFAD